MNVCFLTGRLLKPPSQLLSKNDDELLYIEINFLHYKNYFANIFAKSRDIVARDILEFYTTGDYVVIEGEVLITASQVLKVTEQINITDIQPACI
uniref:Putative single-stranded DNA binding protein n=1 Tax=Neogoniolithon spectabile TaxID=231755 RepID=A0A3G3MGW9_9FLOR|nr:putative single-stranded DNA binding protein [Neogoniolithon spectabile]AYR06088.1 putative single-stranded DNA binding protein [Neogoniolithon spectabile]